MSIVPARRCSCPCHVYPSIRHAIACCDGSDDSRELRVDALPEESEPAAPVVSTPENENGNQAAPVGFVFVCTACGKRSRDKYGEQAISAGWDASCMLNAMLCEESTLTIDNRGRVTEILLIGSQS